MESLLACIPAVAAALFVEADRTRKSVGTRSVLLVLWFVFLPNAPYIATDLIHLTPRPPIPLWFDAALFLSCAGTGLLLGYGSVLDVHTVIARRLGRKAGWAVAVVGLGISGAGLYVGRALRWNSWDVIVNPHQLLATLKATALDPLAHAYTFAVITFCAIGLILGYAALRGLVSTFGERRGI